MGERIRYKKISENVLESSKVFAHPTNGALWRVRINLKEQTWYLLDDGTEVVRTSQYFKKLPKAMIAIREALKNEGVEIEVGTRKRVKLVEQPTVS